MADGIRAQLPEVRGLAASTISPLRHDELARDMEGFHLDVPRGLQEAQLPHQFNEVPRVY